MKGYTLAPTKLGCVLLAPLLLITALRAEAPPSAVAITDLGAKIAADYHGDALGIQALPEGAQLRAGFQKLCGKVSADGLWLESTEAEGGRLHLKAVGIRRKSESGAWTGRLWTSSFADLGDEMVSPSIPGYLGDPSRFSEIGVVSVQAQEVRYSRPGLTEEYQVNVDGVRQDFCVAARLEGEGELSLELALEGASADLAGAGLRLTLHGSQRTLIYHRLQVTDALGKNLSARFEILAPGRLAVQVDDANAVYPVRIDPTFSDADWVSLNPGIPGANRSIYAMTEDGMGNLYVGGEFTLLANLPGRGYLNHIAKWNGSFWSSLGGGPDGTVLAIAAVGNDVYVGGQFLRAGGVVAHNVAKWNGTAWSALGPASGEGLDNYVIALAVLGTDLYVGGQFDTAGGVAAPRIAKWNGSAWSAVGSGMVVSQYAGVAALAVVAGQLYMGGSFTEVGGVPGSNFIAKWDGSTWSSLGAGVNGVVRCLVPAGAGLLVGGNFTSAGGASSNRIAKWSGTAWSSLGQGMDDWVLCINVVGSDVFAGGLFTKADGQDANHLAKWNGSSWSEIGGGTDDAVWSLATFGDSLFVGGGFGKAGGRYFFHIARWSGLTWSGFGAGLSNQVSALAVMGTDLYAGADFLRAGDAQVNHIAKWNGSAWSSLVGGGLNADVLCLLSDGSNLYAGGIFTSAGGVPANHVAKWNGTSWSALGAGTNDSVFALAIHGNDLYAGGSFTTAGGLVGVNHVAKWDGSQWSALGQGTIANVYALAVVGNNLYAGGTFSQAGGTTVNQIAQWDGSAWASLGSGVRYGSVGALLSDGNNLYVGGSFVWADDVSGPVLSNGIARWNGSHWSNLGNGLGGRSVSLALSGGDLYVGGDFTTAGGNAAKDLAKWDGSTWSAMGSGVGPFGGTRSLAAQGGRLYVGGNFYLAGTTASPFIAMANVSGIPLIQMWRQQYFSITTNTGTAANTADADHDGVPNLAEFAFGLIPTHGASVQLPPFQRVGSNLRSSFLQPAGVSGVTYEAQWSTDLSSGWTSIPDTGSDGAHEFSIPVGAHQRLFCRYLITEP